MIAGMAPLIAAVQRNCTIADARHAREMTLCTYLLEMREYYRWEHDMPPGATLPREDIGRWITEREALWEGVVDDEFAPLPLAGVLHEPFAAASVNETLLPQGLVYGAGVGRFRKPHFFLARLARAETHDGLRVLVCDCEYARDLTAIPAALQGATVIVRREALRQWLWEKAEAWGVKRQDGAMARTLAAYDYDADPAAALARMTERETETLILHERGEHAAGKLLGVGWEEMISAFSMRRAELVARAVRDNLADCLVTLPALLDQPDDASLHFWFANFDGMRRELFPLLATAYEKVWGSAPSLATLGTATSWRPAPFGLVSHGGTPLREAVAAGAEHWRDVGDKLLTMDEAAIAAIAADPATVTL